MEENQNRSNISYSKGLIRLWIVFAPIWAIYCVWRHVDTLNSKCDRLAGSAPFTGSGSFEECFNNSLHFWIFMVFFVPIAIPIGLVILKWVAKGFASKN
jgi:hypothetical protein